VAELYNSELVVKSIVGMMDLVNTRTFVTYGKDRSGPSGYILLITI